MEHVGSENEVEYQGSENDEYQNSKGEQVDSKNQSVDSKSEYVDSLMREGAGGTWGFNSRIIDT